VRRFLTTVVTLALLIVPLSAIGVTDNLLVGADIQGKSRIMRHGSAA
jgi:hypothetical protein